MIVLNKKIVLLIGLFTIIVFMTFVFNFLAGQKKQIQKAALTPRETPVILSPEPAAVRQELVIPKNIVSAPTLPPAEGAGVNPESAMVKSSQDEIQKLFAALPYEKNLPLSTGIEANIVIAPPDLEASPWVLTIQIFNIDYLTDKTDPQYNLMRQSFREAAAHVFTWIRENGADPEKIIVSWGDKAYIQDIAKEWLKSP